MEISSRKNPLIKEYRSLMTDRKSRRESGFFPVEGSKLCEEAVKSGAELGKNAFVTQNAVKKYLKTPLLKIQLQTHRIMMAFPNIALKLCLKT